MQLTLSGYSTALFATWYFAEELGILFDAGDGVTSALLQKSRKINHVFISHADRDHLTGLLQLNQLNARDGFPVIHFPKNSGSFPALEAFVKKFDAYANGSVWKPVAPAEEIEVKDGIIVIPIRNEHVSVDTSVIRSLSYKVVQTKQKLKPELANLPKEDIQKIVQERGRESITTEVRTTLIGYSGDTPVEDLARWNNTDILIHEATFLAGEGEIASAPHKNKHSTLEEVMEMVSNLSINKLVLGHFSSRYDATQIDRNILALCDKYGINIPVFRVLPGVTVRDILSGPAVNQ